MKKQTIEQPFETQFGTINVGDPVAFLTTSRCHASLHRGVYLGYTETPGYKETEKRACILAEHTAYTSYLKGTDEVYSYKKHGPYSRNNVEVRVSKTTRNTWLQRNRMIPLNTQ